MKRRKSLSLFCLMLFSLSASAQVDFLDTNPSFPETDLNNLLPSRYAEIGSVPQNFVLIPYAQSLRFNRVDGLFIGLNSEMFNGFGIYEKTGLHIYGQLGYATGSENWQYRLGLTKNLTGSLQVGAELLNQTSSDDYWRTDFTENSLSSLVGGYDYHDYYRAEGYAVFGAYKLTRKFLIEVAYRYNEYASTDRYSDFSFFRGGNMNRLNPALDSASDFIKEESYVLQFSYNADPNLRARRWTNSIVFNAQLADQEGFDNDYTYNRYELITHSYIRLDRHTLIKSRFKVGAVTGEVPDFKSLSFGGMGTMRGTAFKYYTGNRMFLNNTEIVFGNFKGIRTGNLEVEGFYFSLFMDSGWIGSHDPSDQNMRSGFDSLSFENLDHNLGGGIGWGSLRFEIATPIDGAPGYTSYWVRWSPSF